MNDKNLSIVELLTVSASLDGASDDDPRWLAIKEIEWLREEHKQIAAMLVSVQCNAETSDTLRSARLRALEAAGLYANPMEKDNG